MKQFFFFVFFIISLTSYEVQLQVESGDVVTVNVDGEVPFAEVMEELKAVSPNPSFITIERASFKKGARNYFDNISQGDMSDVRFVINTLGFSSLAKIAKEKSALKKAGNRINYIHPLRFLLIIFKDEKMKVAMHAIRDRGVIWKEFFSGIKGGFDEEAQTGNYSEKMMADFTSQLGLDLSSIKRLIQDHAWRNLIDYLIDNIPRDSDRDRYIW